jgi:ABC-type cobalamin/Fe3+-siderophores transport system ATPase subunit
MEENTLVLVGENGSGKSTVIGILYHFLTRQWTKLLEYQFDTITVTINNKEIKLSRAHISHIRSTDWETLQRVLSRQQYAALRRQLVRYGYSPTKPLDTSTIRRLFFELDLDESGTLDPADLFALLNRPSNATDTEKRAFEKIDSQLKDAVDQQILFLPTYRRIERDIQHIMPQARIERDISRFHAQLPEDIGYVELVEFGMKDVSHTFNNTMKRLESEFRAALSMLTTTYLKDIINGSYKGNKRNAEYFYGSARAASFEQFVNSMDDRFLSGSERHSLATLMSSIRERKQIEQDTPPPAQVDTT